jgi:hypothetical protein
MGPKCKNWSGLRPLPGSIMTYRLVSSLLELMLGLADKEQVHHIQGASFSRESGVSTLSNGELQRGARPPHPARPG